MKITKASCYGITAAAQLGHDVDAAPIPCSQLAELGDMPDRFLLQIMRDLVNAGICVSTRGVGGGYRLARPAIQINLAEIIEAIDGPIINDPTERIKGLQRSSSRLVAEAINGGNADMRSRLAQVSLGSMKVDAKQSAGARLGRPPSSRQSAVGA